MLTISVLVGAQKIVIFVENNPQLLQFHQEMAASFVASTGVEVEVMPTSGSYIDEFGVMLASGVQVDMVQFWAEGAAPYMEAGAFANLNRFIDKDPEIRIEQFAPGRIQAFTRNGELLGLPMNANAMLGFYNRDAFQSAGLPLPENMGDEWNWDTFEEYARLLSRDSEGDGHIDQPALGMPLNWERSVPIFAEQAGGGLFDTYVGPSAATLSNSSSLEGLEYLINLYRRGWATQDAANIGGVLSGERLMMLLEGPFGMAYMSDGDPSFDWGVLDLPKGPVHNGTVMLGIGYQIVSTSKQQEIAWEFLKHVATNVDSVNRMVELTGRTPAYIPALPHYKELLAELYHDPTVNIFADKIVSVDTFPGPVMGSFNQVAPIINELIQKAGQSEIPVAEAAAEIDRRVNAILQRER